MWSLSLQVEGLRSLVCGNNEGESVGSKADGGKLQG